MESGWVFYRKWEFATRYCKGLQKSTRAERKIMLSVLTPAHYILILKMSGVGPVVDAIHASINLPKQYHPDSGLGFRFCWSNQSKSGV
jgi:hypothetical protein